MSYSVVFSPEALDRLDAIERYIANEASPLVAARYADAIVNYCESLSTFSERGTRRDDLFPGLRVTNYRGNAVIAFDGVPSRGVTRIRAECFRSCWV